MTPTLVSTFDPAQQFAPCLLELFAQLRLQVKTKLVWPSVTKPSPMRTRGAPLYAQSCRLLESGCWTSWEAQSYRFFHSSSGNLLFCSFCRSEHISFYSHICEGVPFGGHSLTVLSVIVSSTFDAGSFEPFLGRFACDAFFHTAVVMFF